MTSSELNYIFKDPISKPGHIHRTWGAKISIYLGEGDDSASIPTLLDNVTGLLFGYYWQVVIESELD